MGLLEVNNTAWATVFDVQTTRFTRGIISATQECPADFLASDNTVEKSCLLSLLLRCQRCYGADLECNDRMSPTVLERNVFDNLGPFTDMAGPDIVPRAAIQ